MSGGNQIMNRLNDKYTNEVRPKLMEEYGVKNIFAAPKIKKIVINVGAGDAKDNQTILEKLMDNITKLSGQKPVSTKAKQSIAGFKLSKGQSVGVMVTLRSKRMYEFLDKLINIVLPKTRDFRGVPDNAFDAQGNFSLGLKEQALFPEIGFESTTTGNRLRGLEISVVTTAKNQEQGRRLLALLGMPFKKEGKA